MNKPQLILASSSKSRQALLKRLKVVFQVIHPEVDETPLPQEKGSELVQRLSIQKASIVASQCPQALVIGCDQVAVSGGRILGKPLNHQIALVQLQALSGQRASFLSGLCLMDSKTQEFEYRMIETSVQYRTLTSSIIEYYLEVEKPYQCAASLISEGLGICLTESISSSDPSALMGLPLISLTLLLKQFGLEVLS